MSRRSEQVALEVQRILGDLLLTEVRDPRIGFVTITGVEVSSDLENARVHVSVLGDEEEEKSSLQALRRASGFFRTELARRMRLRQVPQLRFEADRSTAEAIRIGALIDEVVAQEDASAAAAPREESEDERGG